jgi:chemotaxis protein methyltransferase CheR
MKEKALADIAEYIHQRSRLFFSGHRMSLLKSRLDERRAELQLRDLAAYLEYLRNSAVEESILLDLLTTNETFFFRNPRQFRYLVEKIVPELEEARGREVVRSWGRAVQAPATSIMKLRILCGGCSTGEEPYSVAMALLETLRYPRAWDIEILAGDISSSCIKTAIAGHYETERLKGIPPAYLDKYVTMTEDGGIISDEVKRLVKFRRMNLNDVMNGKNFPGMTGEFTGFDIIFCRNVMIYFSTGAQQQLVDTLFQLLVPGGYFFTGDAEPLHLYNHDFRAVDDAGCLIYKKMEREDAGTVY